MEKIIHRNSKFEGKEFDYSTTYDYRILATEKRNLDFIDEFSLNDEDTIFQVYEKDVLKTEFSREDYLRDNVDLTLKQGASICKKLEVIENIIKTQKNEKQDSTNLVINRVVKLYY